MSFFFFNDTATTEIYTLSLHDALPISSARNDTRPGPAPCPPHHRARGDADRKSTRLNSSHVKISYAVFCLKKKKKINKIHGPMQGAEEQVVRSDPRRARRLHTRERAPG